MKNSWKRLCCLMLSAVLLLGMLPVTVSAASGKCGANVTWIHNYNARTFTLVGSGSMWDYTESTKMQGPWRTYTEFDQMIIQPGITSIGNYAFANFVKRMDISIPYTIEHIGEHAFDGCYNMNFGDFPTNVRYIGDYAFNNCDLTGDLSLPYGLTYIGACSFDNNSLDSVIIPDTVGTIGTGAFRDNNLTSVTLSRSLSTIGIQAFSKNDLTSVTIPDSVTTIEWEAFAYNALTKVTLPNSLRIIGGGAFYSNNLTGISLPNSVTTIGDHAFYYNDLTSIVIPDSVTSLGEGVLGSNASLTSARLPANLTEIPDKTFLGCTALVDFTMPAGITRIGANAFNGCAALPEITIPGGVTSIDVSAFSSCDNLSTITFEGNAPKITSNSFTGVTATAYYPADNATWTADKLQNYGGTITWVPISSLKITSQPKSVTVAAGETAKVTVGATGVGLTYRWYYKNPGDSGYTYTSSFKGNTYSVSMNEARNGRQILCRVYDMFGNVVQTDTVKLSMIKTTVKVTKQPVSVTVSAGDTAKVTVGAVGDGLTYRWYFKNPGEDTYTYTSSFKGNTYSITMNEARSGRLVLCRVYDAYGNVVQTNSVMLSMNGALRIAQQPRNATAAEGKTAKTTVIVSGQGLTYQWYYANPGSNKFYKTTAFTDRTYYISMNDARDGRRVYCVITDQYGNTVITNTVTLKMS